MTLTSTAVALPSACAWRRGGTAMGEHGGALRYYGVAMSIPRAPMVRHDRPMEENRNAMSLHGMQ